MGRMQTHARHAGILSIGGCALLATPAFAQGRTTAPDAEWVISRACANLEPAASEKDQWRAIGQDQLAYFMAAYAGALVDRDEAVAFVRDAVDAVGKRQEYSNKAAVEVWSLNTSVQIAAKEGTEKRALRARAADGGRLEESQGGHWLLDDGVILECKVALKPAASGSTSQPIIHTKLRLRGTVDALSLKGRKFETAPSAELSYKRARTILADNSEKFTNTFAIKGALGYSLADSWETSVLAYSSYELSKVRVTPPPVLTPPATQADGDTEIVKLGFIGSNLYDLNPDPLLLSPNMTLQLDGSYIFDLTKESERMRASVSLSPNFALPYRSFCGLDGFVDTFIPGLQGSCSVAALYSLNHFTDKGKVVLTAKDDFVHAGFRVKGDWALAAHRSAGAIFGVGYEKQWIIHGTVPDIDRFNAYVKYRFWLNPQRNSAIDVGFDFVDGINPDSFEDQNEVKFSAGILF